MNEELQTMIEQAIIEVLSARRKEKGMTAEELGKKVFPSAGNARMKVQALTQKQGNGKPRTLKVGEFVSLSLALDLDPSRVLSNVLDKFEETKV